MHINNTINACPFAFSCKRKYREIIVSIQNIYFEFSVKIWGIGFGVPWTQKGEFCKLSLRPLASKPLGIVFLKIHTKLGQLEKLFWNRLRTNPYFGPKVHPKVSYKLLTKDLLKLFLIAFEVLHCLVYNSFPRKVPFTCFYIKNINFCKYSD